MRQHRFSQQQRNGSAAFLESYPSCRRLSTWPSGSQMANDMFWGPLFLGTSGNPSGNLT